MYGEREIEIVVAQQRQDEEGELCNVGVATIG
jgi:hypothetical protein